MELPKNQIVWLMDDDATFNFIHAHMIKNSNPNAKIVDFTSPRSLLETFIKTPQAELPNHILLDINMPELNGFELLEKLSKLEKFNRNPITVHVVSSTLNPEDKEQARTFGSVGNVLNKPLNTQKILEIWAS